MMENYDSTYKTICQLMWAIRDSEMKYSTVRSVLEQIVGRLEVRGEFSMSMTNDDLCSDTGRKRSAVGKAVRTLQEMGLIQVRYHGRYYKPTYTLFPDKVFSLVKSTEIRGYPSLPEEPEPIIERRACSSMPRFPGAAEASEAIRVAKEAARMARETQAATRG